MEMDSALEEEMNFLTQDDEDIINNYYYSSSEELTHFSPPAVTVKREKSLEIIDRSCLDDISQEKESNTHEIVEMFPSDVPLIEVENNEEPSSLENSFCQDDYSSSKGEETSLLENEESSCKKTLDISSSKEITPDSEEKDHELSEEILGENSASLLLKEKSPLVNELLPSSTELVQCDEVESLSNKSFSSIEELTSPVKEKSPPKEIDVKSSSKSASRPQTVEEEGEELDGFADVIFTGSYVEIPALKEEDDDNDNELDEKDLEIYDDENNERTVIKTESCVEIQVLKENDDDNEIDDMDLEIYEDENNERTVINSDHNYVTKLELRSTTSPCLADLKNQFISYLQKRGNDAQSNVRMKTFVDDIVGRLKAYPPTEILAKENTEKDVELLNVSDRFDDSMKVHTVSSEEDIENPIIETKISPLKDMNLVQTSETIDVIGTSNNIEKSSSTEEISEKHVQEVGEIPDSQVVGSSTKSEKYSETEEMDIDEEEKAIEDALNESIEALMSGHKNELSIGEELKKTTHIDITIDDLLNPVENIDDPTDVNKVNEAKDKTGKSISTEDSQDMEFDMFQNIEEQLAEEFSSVKVEVTNEKNLYDLPDLPKSYNSKEIQTDLEFVPKNEFINKLHEFASKLMEECRIVSEDDYSSFNQQKLDEMKKFIEIFKPLPETTEISIQTEKIVSEKSLKKKNEKERRKLLASSDSSDSESDNLSSDSESKKSFGNSDLDLSQFLQSDLLVNDEGNVYLGGSEECSDQLLEVNKNKVVKDENESMNEEDLERLREEEEDKEIER